MRGKRGLSSPASALVRGLHSRTLCPPGSIHRSRPGQSKTEERRSPLQAREGCRGMRDRRPGLSAPHIRSASPPKRHRLFLLLQTLPGPLPHLQELLSYQRRFSISRARQALPSWLPSPRPWHFLCIQPREGPRPGVRVRVQGQGIPHLHWKRQGHLREDQPPSPSHLLSPASSWNVPICTGTGLLKIPLPHPHPSHTAPGAGGGCARHSLLLLPPRPSLLHSTPAWLLPHHHSYEIHQTLASGVPSLRSFNSADPTLEPSLLQASPHGALLVFFLPRWWLQRDASASALGLGLGLFSPCLHGCRHHTHGGKPAFLTGPFLLFEV